MKQFNLFPIVIIFASIYLSVSCGNKEGNNSNISLADSGRVNETFVLHDFISKSGDIVNSEQAPFLLTADDVWENKSNYLVLDTRDTLEYEAGHIDGAILVNPKDLVDYLDKSTSTSAYEKIVIACHTGQTSSYYTTLLRLIGHGNVYSLKFGMSGWTKKITPNKIVASISDKYTANLETTEYNAEKAYPFPLIKTGNTNGYTIMLNRVNAIAGEGFPKAKIHVDTLMQNPSKYFIVNYWSAEYYRNGHLPGAILFEPLKSLSKDKMLKYLPTEKPIVIYCLNGQVSASVVAYLRVLGYDAYSLSLGSNAFMHNFTQKFNDKAFNPSRDIADYELVDGKNPTLQTPTAINTTAQNTKKEVKAVPVKKKQKSGGGGC